MATKRSQFIAIDQDQCLEVIGSCASTNFRKASRGVTQLFDQILAPSGLRSTQLTILVAVQVLGPCGLGRLARELVMDHSTVTRNLKPLQTQGLLEVTGKTGRGGKTVKVSEAGRKAMLHAVPYWKQAQAQLISRMGKDRWERVMVDLVGVVSAAQATG
jgi:DNA-binding MarR family transcriptional regulator